MVPPQDPPPFRPAVQPGRAAAAPLQRAAATVTCADMRAAEVGDRRGGAGASEPCNGGTHKRHAGPHTEAPAAHAAAAWQAEHPPLLQQGLCIGACSVQPGGGPVSVALQLQRLAERRQQLLQQVQQQCAQRQQAFAAQRQQEENQRQAQLWQRRLRRARQPRQAVAPLQLAAAAVEPRALSPWRPLTLSRDGGAAPGHPAAGASNAGEAAARPQVQWLPADDEGSIGRGHPKRQRTSRNVSAAGAVSEEQLVAAALQADSTGGGARTPGASTGRFGGGDAGSSKGPPGSRHIAAETIKRHQVVGTFCADRLASSTLLGAAQLGLGLAAGAACEFQLPTHLARTAQQRAQLRAQPPAGTPAAALAPALCGDTNCSGACGSACNLCSAAADAATTTATASVARASADAATAAASAAADSTAAATAEVAVLVMAHETGWAAADAWAAWQQLHGGRVLLAVHLKQGVAVQEGMPGWQAIAAARLSTSLPCEWGTLMLTEAILESCCELLQLCPRLQHIAVVSGADIPVSLIPRGHLPLGCTLYGDFRMGAKATAAAKQAALVALKQQIGMPHREALLWARALTLHHTWLVLSRQHVLGLLAHRQELLHVGAVLHARLMQPDTALAADEFLLLTGCIRLGLARCIQRAPLGGGGGSSAGPAAAAPGASATPAPAAARRGAGAAAVAGEGRGVGGASESEGRAATSGVLVQPGGTSSSEALVSAEAHLPADSSQGGGTLDTAATTTAATSACDGGSDEAYAEVCSPRAGAALGGIQLRQQQQQELQGLASARDGQCGQGAATAAAFKRPRSQASCGVGGADADAAGSGALLDCFPMLVLFHPEDNRHPHTWTSLNEQLVCDVRSGGPNLAQGMLSAGTLSLVDALGLVWVNRPLFFRKVRMGSDQEAAQLLRLLRCLWAGQRTYDGARLELRQQQGASGAAQPPALIAAPEACL